MLVVAAFCLANPHTVSPRRYSFKQYGVAEGLRNLVPKCLLQDRAGFLWVGPHNGLFRCDGSRFQYFGRENGLPGAVVFSLHEIADGTLWVGTRSGLARRSGERFEAAASSSVTCRSGCSPSARPTRT